MARAIEAGHIRVAFRGPMWRPSAVQPIVPNRILQLLWEDVVMNTAANFNGQRPVIEADDAVLLLIDHQSGLFQTVKDMEMTALRANGTTLAKVATLAKIPVITSASVPQGPNGPLIPEIHRYAPHAKYVARSGQINAWDNPDFVTAVKATAQRER